MLQPFSFFVLLVMNVLSVSVTYLPPTPDDGSLVSSNLVFKSTTSCGSTDGVDAKCATFFDLDDSLVLWINFENDEAIVDVSKNSFRVVPTAVSRREFNGSIALGCTFNAIDSEIEIDDFPSIASQISISLRVNLQEKNVSLDSQDRYHNLVSQWCTGGFLLRVTSSRTLVAYPRNSTGYYEQIESGFRLSWDTPYHIVFGITDVGEVSEAFFYVNGEYSAVVLEYRVGGCEDTRLRIGRWGNSIALKGSMDEVMVFSRALGSSEVQALYRGEGTLEVEFPELYLGMDHRFRFCAIESSAGEVFCTQERALSDGVAPEIESVYMWPIDDSIVVWWRTTQPCKGWIRFGFASEATLEFSYPLDVPNEWNSQHNMKLIRLKWGHSYTVQIHSSDRSGTEAEVFEEVVQIPERERDSLVVPKPHIFSIGNEHLYIDASWEILTETQEKNVNQFLKKISGYVPLNVRTLSSYRKVSKSIIVEKRPNYYMENILRKYRVESPTLKNEDAYLIDINEHCVLIYGESDKGVYYALQTLVQLLRHDGSIPLGKITDWSDTKMRGLFDHPTPLKFNSDNVHARVEMVERMAELKYNTIVVSKGSLFYSDVYMDELKEFQKLIAEHYIEMVPSLGSLRGQVGQLSVNEGKWIRNSKFKFDDVDIARPVNAPDLSLLNSDFETGDCADWIVYASSDPALNTLVSYDISDPYEGTTSLVVNNGYVYQYIYGDYQPGTYLLQVFSKGETPCFTSLLLYDENDENVGYKAISEKYASSEWLECGFIVSTTQPAVKIRVILYGRSGPNIFDLVRLSLVNTNPLINVLRCNSTDVEVVGVGDEVYKLGEDFEILDGETSKQYSVDLLPFFLKRVPTGRIPALAEVAVSYDTLLAWTMTIKSLTNTPPCLSDERLYNDYYYPALEMAIKEIQPKYIHLNCDEIRGFQRDSRNVKRNISNAELFAEFLNKVIKFGSNLDENLEFIMWDDMVNPYHNGYHDFQGHYDGKLGSLHEVYEKGLLDMPEKLIQDVWWYGDVRISQMKASLEYFGKFNTKTVFSTSTYDSQNAKTWTEVVGKESNNLGGIITYWGKGSFNEVVAVHADHIWNTRFRDIIFDSFEEGLSQEWVFKGNESELLDCGNDNQYGLSLNDYSICSVGLDISTSESFFRRNSVEVIEDTIYILSIMAKQSEGDININIDMLVEWSNKQNKIIKTDVLAMTDTNVTSEFKAFEFTGKSPKNTITARFGIQITMEGDSEVFIDIFRVKEEFNTIPLDLDALRLSKGQVALVVILSLALCLVLFIVVGVVVCGSGVKRRTLKKKIKVNDKEMVTETWKLGNNLL